MVSCENEQRCSAAQLSLSLTLDRVISQCRKNTIWDAWHNAGLEEQETRRGRRLPVRAGPSGLRIRLYVAKKLLEAASEPVKECSIA